MAKRKDTDFKLIFTHANGEEILKKVNDRTIYFASYYYCSKL